MPPSLADSSSPHANRTERNAAASLVPAVVRAFAVLDVLSHQTESISLARLTAELQIPKSSVRALCNTMVACGYVRQHPDGSYRLGSRIVSLAGLFLAGTDVAREFNSIWTDRRSAPEETVLLSVLSGDEAVYIGVRNSLRPLGLAFRVGLRFPAWASASGKAILAQLPPEEVRGLASASFESSKDSRTGRTLHALEEELALTRQRGYSVDDQGIREGVVAFGAPVFDSTGAVIAGVSVCVSTASLEGDAADRHRDVALEIANELTMRFGGDGSRIRARLSHSESDIRV